MKVIKTCEGFQPIFKVVDDSGEDIIRYNVEIFQDIKYGDWSGMFNDGKPDKVLTDDEVWSVIDSVYCQKDEGESEEEFEKKKSAWKLLGPVVKSIKRK